MAWERFGFEFNATGADQVASAIGRIQNAIQSLGRTVGGQQTAGGLFIPGRPAGWAQRPGGLFVPNAPPGWAQGPGGVTRPNVPHGWVQTESGLFVPPTRARPAPPPPSAPPPPTRPAATPPPPSPQEVADTTKDVLERFGFGRLLASYAAVGSTIGIAGAFGMGLWRLSGGRFAAQIEMERVALQSLLGRERAEEMLRWAVEFARVTPVETAQVVQAMRRLSAYGFGVEELPSRVQAFVDAATALGAGAEGIERLAYVMGQIRATRQGVEMGEVRQLAQLGLSIDRLVNASMGTQFQTPQEAVAYLKQFTGAEAEAILSRGLQRLFGGTAQTLGLSTTIGLLETAFDSLRIAMEPVGEVVNRLVRGFLKGLVVIGEFVESLNRMTRGGLGFGLLLGALVGGFSLLIAALRTLVAAVQSVAANMYRVSMQIGGGGVAPPGASRFNRFLFGAGMAGGFALPFLPPEVQEAVGSIVGWTLMGIGLGSAVAPGKGTAIGGIVGLIIGLISAFTSLGGQRQTLEEIEVNTRQSAEALGEIRDLLVFGGGPRARAILSRVEFENAVATILGLAGRI